MSPESTTPPSALLFDRSDRLLLQFTGPKAAESLTGLVTNDVLGLTGGDGQYACALTNKGRIIADVRILAVVGESGSVESLLADASVAAGVGFAAMIRKYVNPRTVKYTDVTMATSCLTLAGEGAVSLMRASADEPGRLEPLAEGVRFTHREVPFGGITARVVRLPDLGETPAFDLHVAAELGAALTERLLQAGAVAATMDEWHRRRVMAGWPEWGIDMDEGTLAQEANMDALQAISYKKGCYTGQETVARVHFRGHVNKTLRRVAFDAVDDMAQLPPIGAVLLSEADAPMGDARSSALNDAQRGIGIAMLRREVADGAQVHWNDATGAGHSARVVGAADDA